MADKRSSSEDEAIVIKKYANRRLYNTATSSYVTLDHLCQMVQEGVDFVVFDAKSGEDITRSVLTQIIVEEEGKGQNLLPIKFLRQLIGFYGDSLQWMVPSYLDHMMEVFSVNQERMRQTMKESFGGMFPFGKIEDMGKQNMALFENAMKMFAPFNVGPGSGSQSGAGSGSGTTARTNSGGKAAADADSLEKLKAQVDQLQQQLEAISKNKAAD